MRLTGSRAMLGSRITNHGGQHAQSCWHEPEIAKKHGTRMTLQLDWSGTNRFGDSWIDGVRGYRLTPIATNSLGASGKRYECNGALEKNRNGTQLCDATWG